jgi:hypothetical protein
VETVELVPFSHAGFSMASKTPDKGIGFLGTKGHIFQITKERWFWFWAQLVIFSKPRERSIWFLRAHQVKIFPNQRKKKKAKCLSWMHLNN